MVAWVIGVKASPPVRCPGLIRSTACLAPNNESAQEKLNTDLVSSRMLNSSHHQTATWQLLSKTVLRPHSNCARPRNGNVNLVDRCCVRNLRILPTDVRSIPGQAARLSSCIAGPSRLRAQVAHGDCCSCLA